MQTEPLEFDTLAIVAWLDSYEAALCICQMARRIASAAAVAGWMCALCTDAALAANFSSASLPDMRTFLNGTRVETPAQWDARRVEMWSLLQQYYYGTVPAPEARPLLASFHLLNTSTTRGVVDSWFEATFVEKASGIQLVAAIEILHPDQGCDMKSPLPMFVTQTNHRRWAFNAVTRGYLAMITPTSDNDCGQGSAKCETGDPTEPLTRMFPGATFQLITRRSYLTSLCIDFALAAFPVAANHAVAGTPPNRKQTGPTSTQCVNTSSIAMTGHSRNGKQTLIAAAMDTRITAVLDSSSGVPAMSTYRFSSADSFCETPTSSWPGPWWLPSVREWAGREDQLPCDSHFLLGLIAPRFLLAAVAWTEGPESIFSVEQSVKAGQAVYEWLGYPDRLRLDGRPGAHHGFESVSRYIDWADNAFDRLSASFPAPDTRWPLRGAFLHDFNLSAWQSQNPKPVMPAPTAPAEERIAIMLGNPPTAAGVAWSPGGEYEAVDFLPLMLSRDMGQSPSVTQQFVDFGSYLRGTLLFPSALKPAAGVSQACLPGIVWLHPLSYQKGWVEAYLHGPLSTAESLAQPNPATGYEGAVVLAFDQVGFGMRQHEGRDFYGRFPKWSRLGRMVQDAMAAVDVLVANQSDAAFRPSGAVDHLPQFPCVDPRRITLVGYSIGGAVALHAAAADPRVSAVASVSGFEPLRKSTRNSRSGGNQRFFQWHATQPQLSWFDGDEGSIPYDYDDVLRLVAPRPALVYAPMQDRECDAQAVAALVNSSQWDQLQLQQPDTYNVMDARAQEAVTTFIQSAT